MRLRRQLPLWSPLLVALVLLAGREALRPRPSPAPAAAAPSLPLPSPTAGKSVRADAVYRLVAAGSRAQFAADGRFRTIEARCPEIDSVLRFDADGNPSHLTWSLDLRSLVGADRTADDVEPADGAAAAAARAERLDRDLRHLLGLSVGDRLRFSGRAERTTIGFPFGLQQVRWVGRLELGGRPNVMALDLWLVNRPDGGLRLQGVGTVVSTDLPLPRRYFLGAVPECYWITLGLDLEYRPVPE